MPQSDVPRERTGPTQPFPTKPAPFDRQGITEDDLLDLTQTFQSPPARVRSARITTPPPTHQRARSAREEAPLAGHQFVTFKEGTLYVNDRPGLGVTVNMDRLKLVASITAPGANRPTHYRPDGSQFAWYRHLVRAAFAAAGDIRACLPPPSHALSKRASRETRSHRVRSRPACSAP